MSQCRTCLDLIKTGRFNELSAKNKREPYGPRYPSFLDYPHSCSLEAMSISSIAYQNLSINKELYTKWIENNCLNFYMSDSKYALNLWKDRLEGIDIQCPSPDIDQQISKVIKGAEADMPKFIHLAKCKTHKKLRMQFSTVHNYRNITRHQLKIVYELYPAASSVDATKTNLPITQLVAFMLKAGHVKIINQVFMDFPLGTMESIISMSLINALGNPRYNDMRKLMVQDNVCCMTHGQYNSYTKAVGVAARRSSKLPDGSPLSEHDVCLLSYWEMCIARSLSVTDWAEEKKIRCGPYVPLKLPTTPGPPSYYTNKMVLNKLYTELYKILKPIVLGVDNKVSWPEFVRRRQMWIAGGSAGGEHIVVDGEKIRIDKRVYFEKTSSEEMDTWLESEPIIRAVGSEKFEISKARSIYGADPKSYAILTYLTSRFESYLSKDDGFEDGQTGLPELCNMFKRMHAMTEKEMIAAMVDFTDFNYQHTHQAQSLVFEVIKDLLIAQGAHPDMIKAAKWAVAANMNQHVKFPGSDKYIRTTQGLFSGVRTTNFANTLLNKAYYKVAHNEVIKNMGLQPRHLLNIHKGDDVWISNKSVEYAMALFASMQCMGLQFRNSKQLFGTNVGEFLRVRYWKGGMGGYLCRAIGTFLLKPTQSAEGSAPSVLLQGLCSQINILYRRGLHLEACTLLWDATVNFWSNYRHKNFKDVRVPKSVVEKDFLRGGLDLGAPRTMAKGGELTAPIPIMIVKSKRLEEAIGCDMSKAYVAHLSSKLKEPIHAESVTREVHASNVSGIATNKDKYIAMKHHVNEMTIWLKKIPKENTQMRSNENFEEYVSSPRYDRRIRDRLKDVFSKCHWDRIIDTPTCVSVIMRAIHGSPYRDLSTAQRAKGLSIYNAALECIMKNEHEQIRSEALSNLSRLRNSLPYDILTRILQGIRGTGSCIESIMHPNAISWLSAQALQRAVSIAISQSIKTTQQWDIILHDCQQMAICAAITEGTLLTIAKY